MAELQTIAHGESLVDRRSVRNQAAFGTTGGARRVDDVRDTLLSIDSNFWVCLSAVVDVFGDLFDQREFWAKRPDKFLVRLMPENVGQFSVSGHELDTIQRVVGIQWHVAGARF